MRNLTPAQKRLLNRVIIANGLFDNLTLRDLNTRETKTFYNLRRKGLYVYCEGENKKIMLNVGKMINESDFMDYVASFKHEINGIKIDRLKAAREEQSIVNLVIRKTGLLASQKYRGSKLYNNIWIFYNAKEQSASTEESKKEIRAERNKIIDLSMKINEAKTYAYSLEIHDYAI